MKLAAAVLAALALVPPARADEGMWTFDAFPSDRVAQRYGFRPDARWLEHVRLASARLAQGCSASFVSENGLVLTNHHCAHPCIEQLSTGEHDFVKNGFYARTAADEARCPELEVNQLVEITDVTERMLAATRGLEGASYGEAQRAEMARIEHACQTSDRLRCDVVALYQGGVYSLYKYRRFQDVRLVFAPEFAIAFFGGDPDNFTYPRYDLDVAFLRVYEDGRPARLRDWLPFSPAGPKDGELTFVSGNPGGTSRQLTVAQLEYARDVALPDTLLRLAELRGALSEYQRRGPEQARHSNDELFSVENSFKALRGRVEALRDKTFFASRVTAEEELKAQLRKDPDRAGRVLPAFDAIAGAQAELRQIRRRLNYEERGQGFSSELFGFARTVVRGAEERARPNEKRLREYRESALPALTQKLFSTAPVYDELEIFRLGFSLTKLREELGADDPFVKKVLGRSSPQEAAARLVKGTKLADPAWRRRLWEGGPAAVDAAARDDAMIALVRAVDPDAREVRKRYEDGIEATVKRSSEIIARARFELQGRGTYPDATFTPRLSYGAVRGYEENGRARPPMTTFAGAFEHATGNPPFALPPSWVEARPRLDLATPLDLVTTNDIVGGNSGSPVIDRSGRVVGLIFDGNLQSLGGEYGFDERVMRAIAVDSAAVLHALSRIYRADRLVRELEAAPPAGRG
jgi:hypothetical protein